MPKRPLSKCLWPNLCNMHRQTLWNTTPPTLLAPFLLLSKTSIVIYKFIFIAIIKTSEISDWSNLVPHHQWSAAVLGPKSSQIASENGNKSAFRLFPRSIGTKESRAAPDSSEVIISTQMDVFTNPATHCKIYLSKIHKLFVQTRPRPAFGRLGLGRSSGGFDSYGKPDPTCLMPRQCD